MISESMKDKVHQYINSGVDELTMELQLADAKVPDEQIEEAVQYYRAFAKKQKRLRGKKQILYGLSMMVISGLLTWVLHLSGFTLAWIFLFVGFFGFLLLVRGFTNWFDW